MARCELCATLKLIFRVKVEGRESRVVARVVERTVESRSMLKHDNDQASVLS